MRNLDKLLHTSITLTIYLPLIVGVDADKMI